MISGFANFTTYADRAQHTLDTPRNDQNHPRIKQNRKGINSETRLSRVCRVSVRCLSCVCCVWGGSGGGSGEAQSFVITDQVQCDISFGFCLNRIESFKGAPRVQVEVHLLHFGVLLLSLILPVQTEAMKLPLPDMLHERLFPTQIRRRLRE